MKVAFDEHVPIHVVRLLKAVADGGRHPGIEIVSARDFAGKGDADDVPWIERFHQAGGTVIVSGDRRMRSRLHERKALKDAGMIVFFFVPAWCDRNFYIKCAMLLVWWLEILKRAELAAPGQCWEIPFSWSIRDMREVTGPSETPDARKRRARKTQPAEQPAKPPNQSLDNGPRQSELLPRDDAEPLDGKEAYTGARLDGR